MLAESGKVLQPRLWPIAERNFRRQKVSSGLFTFLSPLQKHHTTDTESKMSGKVHGGKGKSGAKDGGVRSQSHSARAGLQFPVGRVKRFLKRNAQNKIRVGAKGMFSSN